MTRLLAIGDVHGCRAALAAVIAAIDLQPSDTLVTLGDYVDRGPDTRGVLDDMIALRQRCRLIPLRGNHERMMLDARTDERVLEVWMEVGGQEALDSYGAGATLAEVPAAHWEFMQTCGLFYETDEYVFVHGNYVPALPFSRQDERVAIWLSLREFIPEPHCSGKTVIVGHTPHAEIFDIGHLIDLDTGCYHGGWLTAMDIDSRQVWQADANGQMRSEP